jgi:hypothetical protein
MTPAPAFGKTQKDQKRTMVKNQSFVQKKAMPDYLLYGMFYKGRPSTATKKKTRFADNTRS